MEQLSQEAKAVLDRLSDQEKEAIKASNPFLIERNAAIARLWNRGVKGNVLVELTGLPHSTIHRIKKGTKGWKNLKRQKNAKV